MSKVGSVDQMHSEYVKGVTDFTKDGECSGCGNCCGNFLPISNKEIKIIKRYVENHNVKEQIRLYPTAEPMIDVQCPFRDEIEKKCTIYPVRPGICRDFRCDKPRKKIEKDKAMYHGKYAPADMRAVFLGRKNMFAELLEELMNERE